MDDADAAAAIEALDGTSMGGRNLRVNEARPRRSRNNNRGNRF
jgi:RNA recognition motif-containing protein